METCMIHTAYLSLGSNLGDRRDNLREAGTRLSLLGEVTAKSSLYETDPVEVLDQPCFLNAAVALKTELEPAVFLREILALEKSMGRIRTRPKGARMIDIDIVLFDDVIVEEPGLTIPHPAMHERMFVLAPLAEIARDVVHPRLHRKISELRDELRACGQTVRRLHAPWANDV
jgi:2-amino-4-hydroxy-6-hydroxymethyldihydropteridine diphosphokinase